MTPPMSMETVLASLVLLLPASTTAAALTGLPCASGVVRLVRCPRYRRPDVTPASVGSWMRVYGRHARLTDPLTAVHRDRLTRRADRRHSPQSEPLTHTRPRPSPRRSDGTTR